MSLCNSREEVKRRVHSIIDKFAERGLRSLAVARQVFDCLSVRAVFLLNAQFCGLVSCYCLQEVPERTKESSGGPWEFVGLLPLFDPPRHDSAETIRRALNLGVNVKMITGD